MKIVSLSAIALALTAFAAAACAQDATQQQPAAAAQASAQGSMQGHGMSAGRGGFGPGMGRNGQLGSVTEAAADHYIIKTDAGESYTVHFDANTRIFKQAAGRGEQMEGRGEGRAPNSPQTIKPSEIKVGDSIAVRGEVDAASRSINALFIVLVDPERVQQLRQMQADFGKTWLQGKVTVIDGLKVTLQSVIDNKSYSFVVDENTSFRKRREPITLADIQPGDQLRAEGAVKDGSFVATSVNVMAMPQGATPMLPRNDAPAPPAK